MELMSTVSDIVGRNENNEERTLRVIFFTLSNWTFYMFCYITGIKASENNTSYNTGK